MAQKVHEVMTDSPITVTPQASLTAVAQLMRDQDIGDVLIVEDGRLYGIITDRDIVVRAAADGLDLDTMTVAEVCSRQLTDIDMNEDADRAVMMMRQRSVRRVPVTDGGRLVGVLSLGDMAVERDPRSVLADISAAEPNR